MNNPLNNFSMYYTLQVLSKIKWEKLIGKN